MINRRILLRNRPNNQNNEKLENENFSGVTTRKRAALQALGKENSSQPNYNSSVKPNKIAKGKSKKMEEIQEIIEVQPVEIIENKNKEMKPLTYEDLINNPLKWPLHSELNTPEQRNDLLNHLLARRHAIRRHFKYLNNNGAPIWFQDESKHYDEFLHHEYLAGNHDYLMESELEYEPLGRNFLENSPKIGPRQRYIITDWIVNTHNQLEMGAESLYLTMTILDRFIKTHKDVMKIEDMIMVASVSLFLSAKVEEVCAPTLEEFLTEINRQYDFKFCHDLEKKILETINFRLSFPLPICFIRHYNVIIGAPPLSHLYSRYFCELSLQDYEASGYSVNQMAASCVFLAQVICQEKVSDFATVWTDQLQAASGLLYTDFKPLVLNLCIALKKQTVASNYRAISSKYNNPRYLSVFTKAINSDAYRSLFQVFREEIHSHQKQQQ